MFRISHFWFGMQDLYVIVWHSYLTFWSNTSHSSDLSCDNTPVLLLSFTEILACTALRALQATHLHLFTRTHGPMRLNFLLFFFCRILQSNSEKTQIVCGPVRTPGAVVLEAGVLEPVTTQTANQREGGKVATTLRSQRLSHSSQLLTGSRVICD